MKQGEDRDTAWAWTVITYLLSLIGGLVGIVVSICWIIHIILYIFTDPPATPFLNDFFISLDDAWGLLGNSFKTQSPFPPFLFGNNSCSAYKLASPGFQLMTKKLR